MLNLNIAHETGVCQVKNLDINFLGIFKTVMKTAAKNNQGFIYVASKNKGKMEQKQVFTQKGLRAHAGEQYITAGAFYHPSWGRTAKNLRWVHAIVLDFDVKKNEKEIDVDGLVMRIADAGLPPASMLVRTPSGGIHAWWFLRPVRATPKAVRLYSALQSGMAAATGADLAAIGAERLWRLPTDANVIYSGRKKYKLPVFRAWRDENRPEDMPGWAMGGQVYSFTRGILGHPGVKKIMEGVGMGRRNEACFSLAVAHLASGFSIQETKQILLTWNQKNNPPMRRREVQKCVNSAARGLLKDFRHYFNAMRKKIKDITGLSVKYHPLTAPKNREDRKRSHLGEWKADLIAFLQKRGGQMMTRQRQLARNLGMPYSTLKVVLNELEKEGVIYRDSVQRGPKSFTLLILRDTNKSAFLMGHTGTHYGTGGISWNEPSVSSSGLGECLLL